MNNFEFSKGKIGKVILLIIIIFVVPSFFQVINTGERGVVTRFGALTGQVMEPGFHLKFPIDFVKEFDVQTQKLETTTVAYSKDLQTVDVAIVLNYHLDTGNVAKLYQEIGVDYSSRIISPAIQESIKASLALFTAQELVELRPKAKDEIKVQLTSRLQNSYVVVDDFSITNFDFSDVYEQAVEAKQVAQQKALQAENDLKRIEIEAKQSIEQAKAQAESIRIQAQALAQNENLVKLKAVEKWNGVLPNYMLGDQVPFINIK